MAVTRLGSAASVAAATLAHTVSAGSDRMLVACFSHEFSGQITVTSVDYGGQAMVEAAQIDTPDTGLAAGCSIWYLLETAIAAASTNIIAPTYSAAPADEIIHAQAYAGVNQTGGATTNPTTTIVESNEPTPNPLIVDLTETDEGCVVAIVASGNASTTLWASAMTEQTDQTDASSHSSLADRLSITNGNIDIEPTVASQNRAAACSASFAPEAPLASEQEGYRFREDDGSESTATWIAVQDVDITRGKETNTRIRVLLDMTGDAPTQQVTLQYRKVGDADSEWRNVP